MPMRTLAAHAALLAGSLAMAAAPVRAADPELSPFVAELLWAPSPAPGSDGRRHLVYELRIANTTASGLELRKIEVLDEPSGKVLLDLAVGQFGVLFLHVALGPGDALARAIAHRLSLRLAQPGVDFSATVARTPVVDRRPVVLGPSLMSAGYIAGNGCCDSIRHVRALLALKPPPQLLRRVLSLDLSVVEFSP